MSTFRELGLEQHLTPQRSNGVRSMIERIRSDARAAE
jgi:cysteine desulfuration protein SufE